MHALARMAGHLLSRVFGVNRSKIGDPEHRGAMSDNRGAGRNRTGE
jgi:hypothetical protein